MTRRLKPAGRRTKRNRALLVNDYPPDQMVGRVVARVRPMTEAELLQEGWESLPHSRPVCIELDDGTVLFAGADTTGTRPGSFLGNDPANRAFVYRTVPAEFLYPRGVEAGHGRGIRSGGRAGGPGSPPDGPGHAGGAAGRGGRRPA